MTTNENSGWVYPTVAMLVVQAMTSLCVLTPAILAPVAAADFGLPPTWIGAFTSIVYTAAMISGTTSTAWILRFGPVQLSSLCMFAVGVGLLIFAYGSPVAGIAAGVVMGVCYGHINPISAYTLNLVSSSRWRPLIFSIKQTGVVAGGAIAGALAPILMLQFGWKIATACIAVLSIIAVAFVWPLRHRFPAELRIVDSGFLAGIRSLQLIIQNRGLRVGALGAAGYSGVQVSMAAFTVLFLHRELGMSIITAGLIFSASQIAGIAGRLLWGFIAGAYLTASKALVAIGLLSAVNIAALCAQTPQSSLAVVAGLCFCLGLTSFGWNGVFIAEVTDTVDTDKVGPAVGGTQFFFFGGVVVVPPIIAVIAEQVGFRVGFLLLVGLAVVAALCHLVAGQLKQARD